jgi:hypothetical protein
MSLRLEGAPDGIAFANVSVSPVAVQLVAARKSRRKLYINTNTTVYLGVDSSVTATTGVAASSLPSPIETAAEIWAIANGSTTVAVVETYDVEA